MSVGMGRIFESVCLSVCPQHNSKMNGPKVFKLGIGNDLRIYPRRGMVLGLKGQRSTLGLGLTAIRRGFELYECLLVFICCMQCLEQSTACALSLFLL